MYMRTLYNYKDGLWSCRSSGWGLKAVLSSSVLTERKKVLGMRVFFAPPPGDVEHTHTHTHRMDVHTLAHSKADTQTTRYNTVQSKNIILKHLFFFLPHGSLKVAILSELLTPVCLHEAKR